VTEVAPLARKLGIKPEMTAVVLNPPDGVLDLFEPLPAGVRLASSGGRTQSDLVLVFAADAAALTHAWPTTQAAMKPGGLLLDRLSEGRTEGRHRPQPRHPLDAFAAA
jgi:hypothetical protein